MSIESCLKEAYHLRKFVQGVVRSAHASQSGKDLRHIFLGWILTLTFVNAIVPFHICAFLGVAYEEPVPIETFNRVPPAVLLQFAH